MLLCVFQCVHNFYSRNPPSICVQSTSLSGSIAPHQDFLCPRMNIAINTYGRLKLMHNDASFHAVDLGYYVLQSALLLLRRSSFSYLCFYRDLLDVLRDKLSLHLRLQKS